MTDLRPGCKINLGLRITGRRADGYHTLATFFYPLRFPADELAIIPAEAGRLSIGCDNPELVGANNILRKTWEEFGNATGIWHGFALGLKKRIPAGAGLGGGSSDAAVFLDFLNRTSGNPLAAAELDQVAFSLGADVPFFLRDGPCTACGAGELLEPAPFDSEQRWLVLAVPPIHASTAEVFRRWDKMNEPEAADSPPGENPSAFSGDLASLQSAPCGSDLTNACLPATKPISASNMNLRNDLEEAAISLWPELAELKARLLGLGAERVAMSGSGASFFGIFVGAKAAVHASRQLRQSCHRVYCLQLRDFGM